MRKKPKKGSLVKLSSHAAPSIHANCIGIVIEAYGHTHSEKDKVIENSSYVAWQSGSNGVYRNDHLEVIGA